MAILAEKDVKGMDSGIALSTLRSALDRITSKAVLDRWWNELAKGDNKWWQAMNDVSKKTLLKLVRDKESRLER